LSRLLAAEIAQHDCLPFSASGLAAMLDVASLMTGSQQRMSLYRSGLAAVLREASAGVAEDGRQLVEALDVRLAVSTLEQRVRVAESEARRAIIEQETRVELAGSKVGQVNGLTIVGNGIQAYLEPARITARVRAGEGSIIDIEREVDLGGAIHSKGVMILTGLLGARYAPHVPLSLIVSLVFEQSYADIDGDSASAAEMLALLSAIADLPLQQSLAITGAIDQCGQILCVGDVSMKVNGFFKLCRDYGLDGSHGVVVPLANKHELLLHDEVIEAVERGQFHVYAIDHLDDAIALFSGLPAGDELAVGEFSNGSFNNKVVERLVQYAQERKDFEHRDD
jgi:predicted ATP-dependent protease